jgi:hypothetical protein
MTGRESCDGTPGAGSSTMAGAQPSKAGAVTPETLLAGQVRSWAAQTLPGDPAVAARATEVAIRSYRGGGSVADAFREARRYMQAWSRHPSRRRMAPGVLLSLAS